MKVDEAQINSKRITNIFLERFCQKDPKVRCKFTWITIKRKSKKSKAFLLKLRNSFVMKCGKNSVMFKERNSKKLMKSRRSATTLKC